MEKHVPFNPAWFEPGADGKSPFSKLFRKSFDEGMLVSESISAAFRALIAQDAAQEVTPPALQVGDVVRLEAWDDGSQPPVGHEGEIYRFDVDGRVGVEPHWLWPADRLTLVRRAEEPAPVDADERDHEPCMVCGHAVCYVDSDDPHMECENCCAKYSTAAQSVATETQYKHQVEYKDAEIAWLTTRLDEYIQSHDEMLQRNDDVRAERDGARAEVERLTSVLQERTCERDEFKAQAMENGFQRDALQARIDAGVRVYSIDGKDWNVDRCLSDNHTALLIDAQPIADRKGN